MPKKTITLICVANSLVDGKIVKASDKPIEYPLDRGKELLASSRFKEFGSEEDEVEVKYISTDEFEGDFDARKTECKEWKAEMEEQGYTVLSPEEFAKLESEED